MFTLAPLIVTRLFFHQQSPKKNWHSCARGGLPCHQKWLHYMWCIPVILSQNVIITIPSLGHSFSLEWTMFFEPSNLCQLSSLRSCTHYPDYLTYQLTYQLTNYTNIYNNMMAGKNMRSQHSKWHGRALPTICTYWFWGWDTFPNTWPTLEEYCVFCIDIKCQ